MSVFAGNINPLTGAQVAGPIYPGRPRVRPVDWSAIPKDRLEEWARIDAKRHPQVGMAPGGRLHRLLAHPAVHRSLRRDIISVIQMPATRRRAKLERSIRARLLALGVPA